MNRKYTSVYESRTSIASGKNLCDQTRINSLLRLEILETSKKKEDEVPS